MGLTEGGGVRVEKPTDFITNDMDNDDIDKIYSITVHHVLNTIWLAVQLFTT